MLALLNWLRVPLQMDKIFSGKVTRRTALFYGAGAIAISIPLIRWIVNKPYSERLMQVVAHPVLLSLIATENDIQQIGEKNITIILSKHELASAILLNFPKKIYQPQLNEIELKSEISKKIKQEYKQGSIEIVNGWIISKTELVQCKLYNLLSQN